MDSISIITFSGSTLYTYLEGGEECDLWIAHLSEWLPHELNDTLITRGYPTRGCRGRRSHPGRLCSFVGGWRVVWFTAATAGHAAPYTTWRGGEVGERLSHQHQSPRLYKIRPEIDPLEQITACVYMYTCM